MSSNAPSEQHITETPGTEIAYIPDSRDTLFYARQSLPVALWVWVAFEDGAWWTRSKVATPNAL